MIKLNQKGVIHLLLPLILIGGIAVTVWLVTNGNPLKLFSRASNEPIVFKNVNGSNLPTNSSGMPQSTSATVRVELTSPLGPPPLPSGASAPVQPSTVSYKLAETPTELNRIGVGGTAYIQHPTIIQYFNFRDRSLGQKFLWVEFRGSNGQVVTKSAQLDIVSACTSCPVSPTPTPTPTPYPTPASSLRVTYPVGGERLVKGGQALTIRWTSQNAPTVMVDLIRPNFEHHLTAPTGDIPNTGFLTTTVPTDNRVYPANDYKIRVMHRKNATIITQSESGTFSIVAAPTPTPTPTATPSPKPDLIITSIRPATSSVKAGTWNYYRVVVKNQGTVAVNNSLSNIYMSITSPKPKGKNTSCQTGLAAAIPAGQSTTFELYCIAYDAGYNTFTAKVDNNNQIPESNENNNTKTIRLYVRP